jgi:peptidoglycan/xylan/chitin deacetylase (PgdA/CDA1 family)
MFHHFHGAGHGPSQGSIAADTLAAIVEHYAERHHLLDAAEYLARARAGRLEPGDVCLTFDDSLLCQYQVALPVLERLGLTAFWFVYSSVVVGNVEILEVYRRFRTEYFPGIDAFYQAFFEAVGQSSHAARVNRLLPRYSPSSYLVEFPFYTDNDRRFRYVRDVALGKAGYDEVMSAMMAASGTSPRALAEGLWMDREQLRDLHHRDHVLGLHSHTHPTTLAGLPLAEQYREYAENRQILEDITGHPPETMSHPCNSYSPATLALLGSLGVTLGFRSNMCPLPPSPLEHPREDHANIVKRLGL